MVGNLDEIVGYSVAVVVVSLEASVDRHVAAWLDREGSPKDLLGRLPVAHDQCSLLEYQRSRAGHLRAVRFVLIDCDVCDSACRQMSAVPQAEQPRWRRPGHRGY